MADVAKLADVSIQTVSRVLNDGDYVAPRTRERVLKAITMLGYQPNTAARTLVTGRSRTIGVASFEATLYGPASTLAAIERAAVDEDYFTSIVTPQSLDHESLISAIDRLQRQGPDGILVIAPLTTAGNTLPYIVTNVPLVAIETGPANGVPVVGVDQHAGGVLATQHLLELGHPTVHHLAGPPTFQAAHQRLIGWRQTLEAAGAPVPPPVDGDWSADAGYTAGKRLLASQTPTAVFSANDQMALGFLQAANEADLRVPHDISLIGFDDIPEAAYFNPSLTTVRQNFAKVGRRSVRLLLDQVENPDTAATYETIQPELVIRHSTAPPPA